MNSKKTIRILIIDDDEDDFEIISDLIHNIPQQNFLIERCSTYEKGISALGRFTHDIYFIDYHLGIKTGIDLLREAIDLKCEKPIVLLTGQGNKTIDMEALQSGAVDYLVKSQLSSEQLDRCIRYSMERSSVLKQFKSSELKFRMIFERSKDIIFISNDQFEFQNINNAGFELFGYEKEELYSNTSQLFAYLSDKKSLLKKLKTEKKIIDQSVEFLTKNRTTKVCLLSASLENDESGKTYVQGIIHDVSLFKRMEEIKQQSEKLEAKGLTIRTLAHEIRNPLNNIILSSEYLKTESNAESLELLNIISRNSKRITDLINELLDSNQYYKLKLEVNDLQKILKEALEQVEDRLELKKIRLVRHYAVSESLALVDHDKMRIAFLNILVNAIEAMGENGELTVTASLLENFHMIDIKDNGCGISQENIKKLFEPYFTTKSTGLGLGLASTFSILQSHKAEVEVASTQGYGTTFTIKVPSV